MKYLVMNTGSNRQQRNAAAYGDKKTGTPNKSRGGRRMRSRADVNLGNIMAYRDRVNDLLRQAGIQSRL